jgi:Negative regulator of sigma F
MTDPEQPPQRFVSGPPEALYDRVRAAVEATHAPTARPRIRIAAALAAATFVSTTIVVIASQVVYGSYAAGLTIDAQSPSHVLLVLLSLIGLTMLATYFSVWRGRRGFGAAAVILATVSALIAPIYAALVLVNPVHGYVPAPESVTVSPWGARCLFIALLVGSLVLAGFAAALRRSVPSASVLRGAALGAAAGAWAGLAVFVFCPEGEHPHLLVGHVLPILGLTVLGLLLTPRLLRP